MKIIRPTNILHEMLFASNLPEADYVEWDPATTYADGDIKMVTVRTATATVGSGYLAAHRGNFLDGNAYAEINGLDVTDYLGTDNGYTPYEIELVDTAGKIALGYIAGGGTGRVYGNDLILNHKYRAASGWTYGAGWSQVGINAVSANGALLSYDAGLVVNQLYYAGVKVNPYTSGGVAIFYGSGTNYHTQRTTADTFTEYGMTDGTSIWGFNGLGASSLTLDDGTTTFVKAIMEPNLPASGGMHIVSSLNGTYRGWASIESGFNPREIATYTIRSIEKYHKCYESLKNTNLNKFPPINLTGADPYWKVLEATNRWKVYDDKTGSQSSGTTTMIWVLIPGAIDAIEFLNLDATTLDIILSDPATDLVTNGTAWTGATGVTQPNSWDKVGTPADFTIDAGALKITVDGNGEGISQTKTVLAATEYQFLGKYRNTAGDIVQYAVYDVTHSADILATTDLSSSTTEAPFSYVFTTPAGCTSVKISLLGKTAGDIVWVDSVSLSKTLYSETVTLSGAIEATKLDIPQSAAGVLTVKVNKSGTPLCGEILPGLQYDTGETQYGANLDILDYSTKTESGDDYVFTEGSYSDINSFTVRILNTVIDDTFELIASYRASPLVWVDQNNSNLANYGYYREFPVEMLNAFSFVDIVVDGLT